MKKVIRIKNVLLQAALFSATLVLASSCTNDQTPADSKEVAENINEDKFDTRSTEKDAQFLVNAAEINLEGIRLGQLARQTSKTTDIKDMGKMMEETHRSSMNELTTLASKKTITIPASQTDKGNDAYTALSRKSGSDFDETYCDMMIKGHKNTIDMFEKASTEAADADIKNWAAASLPALRTHLDHAISSQNKLKK